jgi:hypothetical protein
MKICPMGAELFHADGQTYMTKLIVAFRSFANRLKNALSDSSTLKYDMLLIQPYKCGYN